MKLSKMPIRENAEHCDRINSRSRAFVGLLLMLTLGCPLSDRTDETDSDPLPFAGAEVRLVVPAGLNLASQWTPGFEDWSAQTSASYALSEIDFGDPSHSEHDWFSALQEQSPTLVLLPAPYVNRIVSEGLAAAIPESALTDLAWSRIAPPVRNALGMQGNRPAVFPVTCPTLVACYRKDLLDAAGRKLPETWDEYDALVTSLSEWAPGQVAIEPRGVAALATLFLARAASAGKLATQYSFALDVSTAEPLIASEAFVRTLEQMSALTQHLSPGSASASFEDCWNSLRSGTAAIGIAALGVNSAGRNNGPADTEASGIDEAVMEFAPLPGSRSVFKRDSGEWTETDGRQVTRPALCGFGGLSVCVMQSAGDVEQAAAWDLWAALAGYQDEGVIPPLPGVPCRTSAIATAVGEFGGSLPAASQRSLEQALESNHNNPQLIAELPCDGREKLLSVLSDSLHEALDGGIPPAEALTQAAAAWTAIIEDIGRQQVLNSYRQRLGLTPLP